MNYKVKIINKNYYKVMIKQFKIKKLIKIMHKILINKLIFQMMKK